MPTKKPAKTAARQLATKSRTTAKKAVAQTRATAKKTVAKGRAKAKKAIAKGKTVAQKAVAKGQATARRAAKKVPTKRQATRAASGFVEHVKEGVQSGLDAVGRAIKKVTPNALLPKSTKAKR